MATSAVGSVAKWLGDQLVEEANYLYGVEEKVEKVQHELNWMQCFLQDVDARRDRDARMQEWIREISSLAYEAEDIIETFILKVDLHRHGGLISKLKRYSCIMREAKALHEVGCKMDDLNQKISALTSRLHIYGIKITEQGSNLGARREIQLRKSYAHDVQDEKNIVGLDNDIKLVVKQLLNEHGESRIVALCGMGGLGKTTLAKKVYHHKDVKRHFDAFAWACISQQCQVQGVLAELYQGLTAEKNNGNWTEEFLIQKLSTVQQEMKCLIVLDDIWQKDAWHSLKAAFPINGQNSGAGKLMLTARNESLVEHVDDKAFIHKQDLMDEKDALLLLKKKLRCDDLSDIFGKEQGRKTEELATDMLKHCGGLPLAILALGGVLRTKNSLEQWEATHRNIKSFLYMAKQGGLSSKDVLELSYYDMPMYLKPCFLYLGIFPEDAEISATKLIQLWMAEGFISTDNSGQGFDGMEGHEEVSSLEEIGEAYLGELVERSMVLVASTRENGRIKTCRIHDLVRDLCLSKAAEENFLKVVMVEDSESSPTIIRSPFTKNIGRYRRLAIHIGQETSGRKATPAACLPNKKVYARQIKTLVFVGDAAPLTCKCVDPLIFRKAFKQFRLLRVLDLVGAHMINLPKGVGNLVHLRYLSIRHSSILAVPSSIGNLRCLQTLDLRSNDPVRWSSDVIWRMGHLRHVYLPKRINDESLMKETIKYICGWARLPLEEGLKNVEILLNFDQICRLEDIAQLANLRKFSSRGCLGRKQFGHIKNFKSLLSGRLEHLSLVLPWKMLMEEPDILQKLSAHNISKMKLKIKGDWWVFDSSSPSDGYSLGRDLLPCSVTCLEFICTEITNPDAMQILGKLPNLKELTLSYKSYRRKDIICSQGGFPKLISLSLFRLHELEDWTIEEGTMPSLRRLTTNNCDKLKFPEGMKHLHNLTRLEAVYVSDSYSKAAREWTSTADKVIDICTW